MFINLVYSNKRMCVCVCVHFFNFYPEARQVGYKVH